MKHPSQTDRDIEAAEIASFNDYLGGLLGLDTETDPADVVLPSEKPKLALVPKRAPAAKKSNGNEAWARERKARLMVDFLMTGEVMPEQVAVFNDINWRKAAEGASELASIGQAERVVVHPPHGQETKDLILSMLRDRIKAGRYTTEGSGG